MRSSGTYHTESGKDRRSVKVGLVSPYDFGSPGGVTDHVRHLARELRRLDHQVRMFAPISRADVDFDSAECYRIGSPIALRVNDSVARITLSFHLADRVSAIVERERFDVLHFHEPLMPALPITMLRMSRTANVGTSQAFAKSNIGYLYGRPILEPYLAHLDRGIAVSEPAKAFVNRYFPDFPLRVIPNGIDTSVFHPGHPPIRHLRDDRVNILFVGRLEKRKGLGYLLRAYEFMKPRVPNTRLIVVGDGPLRNSVESYISRHRLPDVVMAGYVPDAVLPRYYCSADIFCAPATGAESFGIVLLDAMGSGLPVVPTQFDGYMSVLEPGLDSLTVSPKGSSELGAALVILPRSAHLPKRMSDYGLEKAQKYAWEEVASDVLEVYGEAKQARARREATGSREVMNVHDAV